MKLASKLSTKFCLLSKSCSSSWEKWKLVGKKQIPMGAAVHKVLLRMFFCFVLFRSVYPFMSQKTKLDCSFLEPSNQKNEKKIVLFLCFGVFSHLCPKKQNCSFWDPSKNKILNIRQLFFSNVLEN